MPETGPGDNRAAMTDEQLRQVTVGELKPHNAPINLVEYDAAWPKQFERETERIRAAIGQRAFRIEHVGSTSVPGVVAKPIIDILLVVADSADEQSYVPALEGAGYILRVREPDWHEHRMFKGPRGNVNLHVFKVGSVEVERNLLFRDCFEGIQLTGNFTRRRNGNLRRRIGSMSRNTQMPSRRLSRALFQGPNWV